ncbi:hypothetical protein K469DRAFT_715808 [Zopfia rhizophila CBS 207.26]|uniref:C2H2-type domain-containing protein n=1 Tax=Zopfia rhizophila CBS 207.26 TaxID=1314779 RepID=A0A6A6DKA0_9PEZI|nr:hypothetical protein K469DRAFT_715808 [Zopfia rhizophila CBS 207.26]
MPSRTRKRQDPDSSSESDFELDKSCFSLASHTESSSDTEVEEELSGDTEVEEELNSDTEVEEDADSEGNLLRQRMAFHKSQGRAKSKRGEWAEKLVAREFREWGKFCSKLKLDPSDTLRRCEADKFKTYLEWRVENSRIKKESTIKAYWRRILCSFIDVTGHSMDNGAELDIQDWIPTYLTVKYGLDTSEKEKHAMYVQDLYVILSAHWTMDAKPRHGRFRVQMDTILLLCGATSTRPQALIESSSAKGSNKALSYEHIDILRVRDKENRNRTTTIARVSLVHIKTSGGKGRRKRFIFHLESIPAFCIVSRLVSHAIADDAFRRHYTSPEEIFTLEIPAHKPSLKVRFKQEILNQPIFRDIEKMASGSEVSDTKALPYSKCRDHFVWLGRVAGFEQPLELYQLRRASGRKMNSVLPPEERNQTMGHHGDTYQQFYLPDLIERDFQSIYFGTPSQDELIQHAARMGISRDERAPTGLTDEQKLEFKLELDRHPKILRLRAKREQYKQKIRSQGYHPIDAAKGTKLYDCYDEAKRKLHSLTNVLRKRKEDQAVLDFHDAIDDYDIERQLNGNVRADLPTRSTVQYEFRERAVIAKLLSQPLNELEEEQAMKLRMKFIRNLVKYCTRQESRLDGTPREAIGVRLLSEGGQCVIGLKRVASDTDVGAHQQAKRPRKEICLDSPIQEGPNQTRSLDQTKEEDVEIISSVPMTFTDPVCLLCIREGRIRRFKKKDSLGKHVNNHKAEGAFKQGFFCWDPSCSEWIEGEGHFKNHAALKHGVRHPVQRYY